MVNNMCTTSAPACQSELASPILTPLPASLACRANRLLPVALRLLVADCLQLAADIELQLFKPPDVESDDPNIAAPGWVLGCGEVEEAEAQVTADIVVHMLAPGDTTSLRVLPVASL